MAGTSVVFIANTPTQSAAESTARQFGSNDRDAWAIGTQASVLYPRSDVRQPGAKLLKEQQEKEEEEELQRQKEREQKETAQRVAEELMHMSSSSSGSSGSSSDDSYDSLDSETSSSSSSDVDDDNEAGDAVGQLRDQGKHSLHFSDSDDDEDSKQSTRASRREVRRASKSAERRRRRRAQPRKGSVLLGALGVQGLSMSDVSRKRNKWDKFGRYDVDLEDLSRLERSLKEDEFHGIGDEKDGDGDNMSLAADEQKATDGYTALRRRVETPGVSQDDIKGGRQGQLRGTVRDVAAKVNKESQEHEAKFYTQVKVYKDKTAAERRVRQERDNTQTTWDVMRGEI